MFLIIIGLGIVAYALTRSLGTPVAAPEVVAPSPSPAPMPKAESPKPSPKSLAAPAAPLPLPRYPVGLIVKFDGKKATIKAAWQDGQGGWHFKVDIDAGLFFKVKDKAVSEQFMRDTISNALKQPLAADQAFPLGVEVYRNGKGGLIEAVSRSPEGLFVYRVRGWDSLVTQGALLDELVKA